MYLMARARVLSLEPDSPFLQFDCRHRMESWAMTPSSTTPSWVRVAFRPSLPNIEALIALVENLRIQEELRLQEEAKQIKLHNQRNAKCQIQHKEFLDSQEVKVEAQPTPKKVWRKKVSSPVTP